MERGNSTNPLAGDSTGSGFNWDIVRKEFETKNKSNDCPHCGRCPRCGRGKYEFPTYPIYPQYPPYNPMTPIYCSQSVY